MIKLDKCPFCGGEAIFNTTSEFRKCSEHGFYYKIKCTRCGITYPLEGKVLLTLEESGTVRYIEDNRLELASKWNTRIMEEAENDRS